MFASATELNTQSPSGGPFLTTQSKEIHELIVLAKQNRRQMDRWLRQCLDERVHSETRINEASAFAGDLAIAWLILRLESNRGKKQRQKDRFMEQSTKTSLMVRSWSEEPHKAQEIESG